jgi:hypothetical protein
MWAHAACTCDPPSVSSVNTLVPEEHAGCATMLKHLQSYSAPSHTHIRPGLPIAPAVQAIIVDRKSVVDPQLAAIIRN